MHNDLKYKFHLHSLVINKQQIKKNKKYNKQFQSTTQNMKNDKTQDCRYKPS